MPDPALRARPRADGDRRTSRIVGYPGQGLLAIRPSTVAEGAERKAMTRPVPSDLDPSERGAFALASTERCPAPELLSPAMEGTLPEPLRGQVFSHLQHCSICRTLADAQASPECTEPTIEETGRIRARVTTARRSHLVWWRPAAAAAVLTLAIGGAWLSQFDRQGSVMPAPPTAPVAASTRVTPDFRLALEKPTIELPASALVVRSGDS